ncbi:MAG: hypothetical protein M3Q70_02045 [bacterium]|nr:hypothetical protein [bacterium]
MPAPRTAAQIAKELLGDVPPVSSLDIVSAPREIPETARKAAASILAGLDVRQP